MPVRNRRLRQLLRTLPSVTLGKAYATSYIFFVCVLSN